MRTAPRRFLSYGGFPRRATKADERNGGRRFKRRRASARAAGVLCDVSIVAVVGTRRIVGLRRTTTDGKRTRDALEHARRVDVGLVARATVRRGKPAGRGRLHRRPVDRSRVHASSSARARAYSMNSTVPGFDARSAPTSWSRDSCGITSSRRLTMGGCVRLRATSSALTS